MSDLTTKITLVDASRGRYCQTHRCDLITDAEGQDRWHFSALWYCEQCRLDKLKADRDAHAERVLNQRRERLKEFLPQRQLNAGIPKIYRHALLKDLISETTAQQAILATLHRFIASHGQDPLNLIMIGRVGAGKTFAACSVINEWLLAGHDAYLVTMRGLIREIRATWREGSSELELEAYARLARLDLLVVDEVDVRVGSDNESMILFDVLSRRHEERRPTILIGNVSLQQIKQILGDRLIDRLGENEKILSFDWPSRRGQVEE